MGYEFDSNWTGITQMMAKDAYLNLDELLPEYAPDLYAKYEETGVLASAKIRDILFAFRGRRQ